MRSTDDTFYNEKDPYFDEDAMCYETRCRLKSEYEVCFRHGFNDTSRARMRGYINALQDMYLMSINEATRVQDCMRNEVPTLTDDCLNYFKY